MTRINLVAPETLSRNHLIAEYRELPRIFGLVREAQARGLTPSDIQVPASYVLGPGHMKFFYTRLGWLEFRFRQLVLEMQRRGYEPNWTDVASKTSGLDLWWFGTWEPSVEELAISQARIDERLQSRMTYKHKPGVSKSGLRQLPSAS